MGSDKKRHATKAFTLLELLLVISIIAILIVILVPALINRSKDAVAANSVINSLRISLESYYDVYKAYPPSQIPSDYPNSGGVTSGAECLYYFLHGPQGNGWGPTPDAGNVLGTIWDPPAGVRDDWLSQDKAKPRYYVDGLGDVGKPILYYRSDFDYNKSWRAIYNKTHNEKYWTPQDAEWYAMIKDPDAVNSPYNPRSYLLIAPGNDGEYGFQEGSQSTDDITNFRSQR